MAWLREQSMGLLTQLLNRDCREVTGGIDTFDVHNLNGMLSVRGTDALGLVGGITLMATTRGSYIILMPALIADIVMG